MIPANGIILVVLALFPVLIKTESSIPVFVWNSETGVGINDEAGNPFAKTTADKLSELLSVQRKIVLFRQDELSVEDFKSGGLDILNQIDRDRRFFAPSVTDADSLHRLLSKGIKSYKIKSTDEIPVAPTEEKTLWIINLPAIDQDFTRKEGLIRNGGLMKRISEKIEDLIPGPVTFIFTAKRNSQFLQDQARRRITRSTRSTSRADGPYLNDFINVDNHTYIFLENAPMLRIGVLTDDSKSYNWGNFTLDATPNTAESDQNVSSAAVTRKIVLSYAKFGNESTVLNSAKLTLNFTLRNGYWSMANAAIDLSASIASKPLDEKGLALTPADVSTPSGFSYHCTPKLRFASVGFVKNGSQILDPLPKLMVSFETNGIQLQPFKVQKGKFGNWSDCQGFFTEGIWAAILIGLVLAMMLAWAVSMVADIKSPDRFDDPKGKTITITATE